VNVVKLKNINLHNIAPSLSAPHAAPKQHKQPPAPSCSLRKVWAAGAGHDEQLIKIEKSLNFQVEHLSQIEKVLNVQVEHLAQIENALNAQVEHLAQIENALNVHFGTLPIFRFRAKCST